MEQFTEPVEGQNDGQELAATPCGPQVSDGGRTPGMQQGD